MRLKDLRGLLLAMVCLTAATPCFAQTKRDYEHCGNRWGNTRPDQAIHGCSEIIVAARVFYLNSRHLARSLHNRGVAYAERGDLALAIADFTAALRLAPHQEASLNGRGNAHFRLRDYPAAIGDYTEALRQNPRYALAHYNRARTRRAANDIQGAIADLDAAIAIDPEDSRYLYWRCRFRALAAQELTGAPSDCDASLSNADAPEARESQGFILPPPR